MTNQRTTKVPMTPYGAPARPRSSRWGRVRGAIRDGARAWGEVTASTRARPDYLIIGTKRGGTTSLARWLVDHPHVSPLYPARETRKGTYYFDVNYGRGEAWYRSHFPTRASLEVKSRLVGRRMLVGEATPYYLAHPHAAVRARRYAPHAKIIVLLRDPVERAHSHWLERTRNGVETLSFADAIAAEPARLDGEWERMVADPSYVSYEHQHFGYMAQSDYFSFAETWLDLWPEKQFLVLRSEDLYQRPAATYQQVLDYLHLDAILPSFRAYNRHDKAEMDPEIRHELQVRMAPSIAKLEDLVGRPMNWW